MNFKCQLLLVKWKPSEWCSELRDGKNSKTTSELRQVIGSLFVKYYPIFPKVTVPQLGERKDTTKLTLTPNFTSNFFCEPKYKYNFCENNEVKSLCGDIIRLTNIMRASWRRRADASNYVILYANLWTEVSEFQRTGAASNTSYIQNGSAHTNCWTCLWKRPTCYWHETKNSVPRTHIYF